ncbi:UDP-N-acetylglucosamine diphosphorylase/glucosamine-1-phosphate N-acetyltransferase [Lentilactobacillus parafarraginis F0439]|jgi:bifunctional UDP-N-acetylglucosamine pyrophosphorylase/glucosamine-1-phosphate N-acetyltransferase|uniref:Bifunctional protein GlmU n=2 Tax=Lentilactobacillus parafarraginis TaxID=390842 RepID=A0A0R1YS12_9LACO|nr:bifunctional UDP-N-acetylglucosamine diphosphorylase/glucosamine-1-phosphate N-acetyltransferase GlmU [Lentilactobacillus parafarraginis]EHM00953.1 UDP-N-acetylglucosamine diphosphorylase/glucosamine-1-phosphate N-acetyltransferase [Lentilactobacillus parafarraginis F0439]KRM44898.1 UDP-N-acetylglucosamine diphosphorylase glucosamine-1-phosphate N-acetyltransferase [Lentilactobacillus parafarraginis DSM 18390 = JCM 14109]
MATKNTIILAAGKGTRMKSKLYKVLHRLCGKTMVDHVLTQVEKADMDNIITIVGFGADAVRNNIGNRTQYAVQEKQLGTGHAVLQAEKLLGNLDGMTMVVSGDTPLLTAHTFENLFTYHRNKKAKATILTSNAPDPTGYGRIVRNDLGIVEKIVEQKDATKEEQAIHEINTGVYVFDNQALFQALHQINNQNAQGEYYLTDVIEVLKSEGETIAAYKMADFDESMGVNDRVALARATKIMQARINRQHMMDGISMIDPERTYIDADVKIGSDTILEPGVQLKGTTTIGSDCYIGANSEIRDSTIHDHVTVTSSLIEESEMADYSDIGPNSHLRPNAVIGEHVHLGNFVEVKKASIGAGTKVGHLTYVGNAKLGKNINVGCGVVFVNYDGAKKHETVVGDDSFVGSNSNLIAPLQVADHSFIAAGSTINRQVNQYDMAIARSRQTNKPGYFKKLPYQKD